MASNRIVLNVGGTRVEVSLSTIRKFPNSLLGEMFASDENRPEPEENGEYFFDRNGRYFEIIMDFYRTETVDLPHDITSIQLKNEFNYWKLPYPNIELDTDETMKEDDNVDISEDVFDQMTLEEKFACAKAMILHKDADIIIKGVSYMLDVLEASVEDKLKADTLYFIALGYYRLGNVAKARLYSQKTLEIDPNHYAKTILVITNDVGFSYAKAGLLFLGALGAVSMIFWSLLPKKNQKN